MIKCILCVLAFCTFCGVRVRGLNARNAAGDRVQILKSGISDHGEYGLEGGKGEDVNGRRGWLNEMVEVQSKGGWRNATNSGTSQCSRYCIVEEKKSNEDGDGVRSAGNAGNPFIANVLKFNFAKDELREEIASTFPVDCAIYVSFNCEKVEEGETAVGSSNLQHDRVLIDRDDLKGYAEAEFHVDDGTTRIHVDIRGILSGAVLEIPTDTHRSEGVKVNAREAPPGDWHLKLLGVGSLNYSVAVLASKSGVTDFSGAKINLPNGKSRVNVNGKKNEESEEIAKSRLSRGTKPVIERSIDSETSIKRDQSGAFAFPTSITRNSTTAAENETNGDWNPSPLPQDIQDGPIASKGTELRAEPYLRSTNITMRMVNAEEKQEFSEAEDLTRIDEENVAQRRGIVVDVNANTNLIVIPGTIHRTVFDVTNNNLESLRCFFKVKSTHFRIYNLQPVSVWIFAGQTNNVVVDVVVPREVSQDTINTISLFVEGSEVTEKSVYQYVQGWTTKITDDVKPTIEYLYNDNCAGKLDKDRCAKSRWSVDITVQDTGSGLKRVTSTPNNLVPRTNFITGTKSSVTFYYSSTCCSTTAKIKAVDLLNNYNERTIDVTAWDNLSQGEIAAIVVGALLILLIIILIIFLIVYCVRSRKSQDLPYTQRYGSRATPRAERTSF